MGRDYTPYCILETTFILSDPRYKTLPAAAAKLYVALWARAFQDRRETLPDWYGTAAMQEDSRLDARTVRKSVPILQQRCLIEVAATGAITVCGVRAKGRRIKWKDGELSDQVVEQVKPNKASSQEKSKSKSKKKIPPTPPGGLFETKGSSKKPEKKGDPRVKEFIDWWFETFQAKFGAKYQVQGAKDGQTVKRLLKDRDIEALKGLGEKFFASEDDFILQSGYTLGVFSSQINKLLAQKKVGAPPPGAYDHERGAWTP